MENMVTVNDLMDAASLSESDFLIINQMTVEGRSTRKITLQQVSDWAKTHNHIVGEGRIIFRDIDEWDLAENRLLKASYQLIEIADYPELCEVMYCGDNKNNTAPWWYKCDHQGNRTITGLCMRVCSPEGLFPRIAGVNKVYGTAGLLADNIPGNTPYDGNDVGTFQPDQNRLHNHGVEYGIDTTGAGYYANTETIITVKVNGNSINWHTMLTQPAGSQEARPAALSCRLTISY